ncbi:SRPBCC domain-containing protein [Sphaerimonospora thailandensis]|uniref:ATPase n=1 Tax=Sphaerimonospora thailandensis TaxID=795644 RepID=A0A8J3RE32_9ACTN|nr:SRPBCC domain-containing protein [Sphaerimonospora thailandensis]GIH73124.1 ATPase [Sphaerimonospora thailandensis]
MAPVTIATPSDRAIVMTRTFAAPRSLVFAAWTESDLIKRWYGARDWDLVSATIDLRVGGAWRFVWRGPGGASMAAGGAYREIVAPTRLAYTESFDDAWYPGQALVTHDLAERGGTTTLTTTYLFNSRQIRDLVLESPMKRGVAEGYDRLDDVLREIGEA